MPIYILLILAIVQGATEFLPISSSGHLALLYNILGVNNDQMLLTILLHIATLIAVLIYYRKEIITLILHPLCPTNRKLVLSTIATTIVYMCLHRIIKNSFDGKYLFVCFIFTAILLLISDYMSERNSILTRTKQKLLKNPQCNTLDITHFPISYSQAIVLGFTQGIAIMPGISRSGSTIAVANMMGVASAPTYSFLLSIPAILGGLVATILDGGFTTNISSVSLLFAMLICTIIGLVSIWLVGMLNSKNKLCYFSYYLIALSSILVIISFF